MNTPTAAWTPDLDCKHQLAYLEHIPSSIFVLDDSLEIIIESKKLKREFHHLCNNVNENYVSRIFVDHSSLIQEVRKIKADKKSLVTDHKLTLEIKSPKGIRAFDAELTPFHSKDQQFVIVTINKKPDIQKANSLTNNIMEAIPAGMIIIDAEGTILDCNDRLLEIFGYEKNEIVSHKIEKLIPKRYRSKHIKLREGYTAAPSTRMMGENRELSGQHKSGLEIPVEVGLNLLNIPYANYTVAVINDISEQKRNEKKLKQANADLDEFVHVASHDLRSPLRGIQTLAEWIEEDLPQDTCDNIRNNLERVKTRISRMDKLISDLLDYARSDRCNSKETITVKGLVEKITQLIPPSKEFSIICNDRVGEFKTAATPLETVLRNLISNAIMHHDKSSGHISVNADVADAYCIIEICDDGPGIPKHVHDRIFKLFQTLSEHRDNHTGIGLAVTKRLVESNGGNIQVFSTEGSRGSKFTFSWPRYQRRDLNE